VRAFIPNALPPDPPLDLDRALTTEIEAATHALGRLDGAAGALSSIPLFLYSYVRREAVLSSRIEGTQSSLSDLLLFELDELPGVPLDDAAEVSSYVAALEHGVRLLRDGLPISVRSIREIHRVLLAHGRGAGKEPGEIRRTQNWIGGSRPGVASFVPPPPEEVADALSALERFIHAEGDGIPALVRAGVAHVQFETIHPFLDGNGRVGRMLITLMLLDAGLLREPLLYLSLHLKEHRATYYDHLEAVRRDGDWESWLKFFLDGVRRTADDAVRTAERLGALITADRERVRGNPRRGATLVRVLDAFAGRPILTLRALQEMTGMTFTTVGAAVRELDSMGIVREMTRKRRNRVFAYERCVEILSEGS
jgi:Fic family protein